MCTVSFVNLLNGLPIDVGSVYHRFYSSNVRIHCRPIRLPQVTEYMNTLS